MTNNLLDGLSLVDTTGRVLLATTVGTLLLGVGANVWVRGRYAGLERDLKENPGPRPRFAHPVLGDIVRSAEEAARRSPDPNTQAIVEEHIQSGLGKLIHLVAGDPGGVADVTQGVTSGLTEALSGMAVAFSNSLVGIGSAVVLTVLGVFSNLTDRRVALMVRIETHLDRLLSEHGGPAVPRSARAPSNGVAAAGFGESVERLEAAVAHFESALQTFSTTTRDFTEFNAHLKDNVQRMSLSFGDLSDTIKGQVVALRGQPRPARENGQ
jgi:hypothetical protein